MSEYTLHLGDCLAILPTLTGISAVITDPPYGIAHRRGKSGDRGKGITLGTNGIHGDDAAFNPLPWLDYDFVVLWGANWYASELPPGRWLIWDKQEHGGSGDFSEAEVAWCNQGRALKIFRHMWLGVQRASEIGESRLHPTQKPVALMKWCIQTAGVPIGATILDPYMGSGATGVACLQLGYNFIGIEISEDYYRVAEKRIQDAAAQPLLLPVT